MRVGTTHDLALVLKYLHPSLCLPEVFNLPRPLIHNLANLLHHHQGKGDVRSRMEAHHTAGKRWEGGGGNEKEEEEEEEEEEE